jgi:hypothetical protein
MNGHPMHKRSPKSNLADHSYAENLHVPVGTGTFRMTIRVGLELRKRAAVSEGRSHLLRVTL